MGCLDESVCLQALNLIVLAPSETVVQRTALTGRASWPDVLFLTPGLAAQQEATIVNRGEYPATAAMTTGYILRVENQATAAFLQRIGRTGHLTTLHVQKEAGRASADPLASLAYLAGICATVLVVALLLAIGDTAALGFLGTLMAARALHVGVLRQRAVLGWKGMPEPGVHGDLLVLVSQDKWIRMQGLVDDLKTVTCGAWLADMTPLQSFAASTASLLVYASMAFAWKATPLGAVLTAGLLALSAALLGICNATTSMLRMLGCTVEVVGVKKYARRLHLAKELMEEMKAKGHEDSGWAVTLGLIQDRSHLREVIL